MMHSHGLVRLRAGALTVIGVLLGVLTLAGCGVSLAGTPAATPTPDAATILQRTEKASYQDVTFALNFSTTDAGTSITGTGSGTITTNPKRMQMTLSFPLSILGESENLTIDIVTDSATNTTYTRVSGVTGVPATWTKSDSNTTASISPIDVNGVTDYTAYTNAKLVGTETLNGVRVWHIQASPPTDVSTTAQTTLPSSTATAQTPTTSSTADIYIRQDNYYPLKATIQVTGDTPVNMTINFTKFNSGATITLPAA